MAIYHCTTKPIKRSAGRSAVASAAYRSGEALIDERTGITHDYTKKGGVIAAFAFLPNGETCNRSQLWNAAEAAEKRKDARTAREWVVALPSELSVKERLQLATDFALELGKRYGVAVDLAIHAPDKEGDQRNHHAHILTTTRKAEIQEGELILTDKASIELSDKKRGELKLGKAKEEVKRVRQLWADTANNYLQEAGLAERVDHRSLKEQGIDRLPTVKMGVAATQMERKGITTDRGDINRRIVATNTAQAQIAEAQRALNLHAARLLKASKQEKLERNARLTPEKIKQIRVKHHNRMVDEYQKYEADWRDRIYGTSKRIVELEEKRRRYDKEPDQEKYRNLLGWITDKKLKQYKSDWIEWNKGLKDIDSRIAKEKEIQKGTPKGLLSFDDYSKNQFKKDHPEVLKEEARILESEKTKPTKPKIMDMKALRQERATPASRRPKRKQDRDIEM